MTVWLSSKAPCKKKTKLIICFRSFTNKLTSTKIYHFIMQTENTMRPGMQLHQQYKCALAEESVNWPFQDPLVHD